MKAAVLTEPGKIIVTDVAVPVPGPEEVLVRVAVAGICGSDHSLYLDRFGVSLPVIPGHEAVGQVAALGRNVSGLRLGQRVTLQPNISCGTCSLCRSGHKNLCANKVRLGIDTNGVFAEWTTLPAEYVWPLPDDLVDAVAVFAEPLAIAVHAMQIRQPRKEERVLIFGAGIIGLLTLQMAALGGAAVTVCDLSPARLTKAKELGASCTIGPDDASKSWFDSFNVIYETSGAAMALAEVMRFAAPRAKIIVLSLPGKSHPVLTDMLVRKELQIMGSLIYTDEFSEAIALLQSGRIKTKPLQTGKISLQGIDAALHNFSDPERMKTLVIL